MRRVTGTATTTKEKGDGRVLPRELLDNGQGKFTMLADGDSDMDISVVHPSLLTGVKPSKKRIKISGVGGVQLIVDQVGFF